MDLQLSDKKAFVSGSTAGIGLAIASALAGEGCEVVINGRSRKRIEAAMGTLLKKHPGSKISGVACDFSDTGSLRPVLDKLEGIDILINNVGIFESSDFMDTEDTDWYRIFQINVMSGILLSRACLPYMKDQNWGRIIFISSESGVQIPPEMIHYGVTKAAQIALANGLAKSMRGTGITVNSVLPGPTWSEGAAEFVSQALNGGVPMSREEADRGFSHFKPHHIRQRFATVEEVAGMVIYLASPLAAATTGAALRVDGGDLPNMI